METRSFYFQLRLPAFACRILDQRSSLPAALAHNLLGVGLKQEKGYGAVWNMLFDGHVGFCLDWDHTELELVQKDIAFVGQIMPELGAPSIYKTKSGFHAIWPKTSNSYTIEVFYKLLQSACHLGKVCCCDGHIAYSLRDIQNGKGPNIRVGKKYKEADIKKVIAGDDSPVIRTHDRLLRLFNTNSLLHRLLRQKPREAGSMPF